MVMSEGHAINLITLFLGRLRPPKWLTVLTAHVQYTVEGKTMISDGYQTWNNLAFDSDVLLTAKEAWQ